MSRRGAVWVALLGLASLALAQQRPRPAPTPPPLTFGAGVEIVNLSVSVTDERDRYVTGLDERDFVVFEDGIEQELTLFTHEVLPISMVIMMDTSSSMEKKLPTAQAAARNFVGTLNEEDRAQVVQFNDRTTVLRDYTGDHAELEGAIGQLSASGPTALHNALYVSLKGLEKQKDVGELRRLAVVLLSDGEDTASLVDDETVIELARQTEVAIYAISLRPDRVRDRERLRFSQAAHLLTVLTRDTGGQVHFPNSLSELDAVYERIAEELRSQYSMGYVSSNQRRDGKWRRIVVRVRDRDDLLVRHKRGYYGDEQRQL